MNLWRSLQKKVSIKYAILAILVTCIAVGSYISYAMFTVTEEKNNAISIVTGNLYYDLKVDGAASNALTVPANSFKEFIITLTNTNNRTTRLNLYYVGNVSNEVDVAYIEEGYNSIPTAAGENFANGASKQYKIRVSNTSSSSVTVNLGVEAGLDYNDLSIPSAGNVIFSPNTSAYELAYYLNHVYLDTSQGFMTDDQKALIEVNTWYLGTVGTGDSYRLAKYTTATGSTLTSTTTASKAGTLRLGELFAGQTAHSTDTVQYWLLTPHNTSYVRRINTTSYSDQAITNNARGVVPVISLNSNVKIVGGDGTKNNPFQISA